MLEDEEQEEGLKEDVLKSSKSHEIYENIVQKIKTLKLTPTGKIVGVIQRSIKKYCGQINDQVVRVLKDGS